MTDRATLVAHKARIDAALATARASEDPMAMIMAAMDAMNFASEGTLAVLIEHETRLRTLEAAKTELYRQ